MIHRPREDAIEASINEIEFLRSLGIILKPKNKLKEACQERLEQMFKNNRRITWN